MGTEQKYLLTITRISQTTYCPGWEVWPVNKSKRKRVFTVDKHRLSLFIGRILLKKEHLNIDSHFSYIKKSHVHHISDMIIRTFDTMIQWEAIND